MPVFSSIIYKVSLLLLMTRLGVGAFPVIPAESSSSTNVSIAARSGDNLLLGYVFVPEDEAEELNKAGTLTALPSKDKPLGDGAYLSPRPTTMFPTLDVPKTYSQCSVEVGKEKLDEMILYFLAEQNLYYKPDEINSFLIKTLHGKFSSVIILASFTVKGEKHIFMRIPPAFLERSSKSTGNQIYGKNTLGLKVHCVPVSSPKASKRMIAWEAWPEIKNWPLHVKV
ncbi:hypothetical protein C8J55DRAFT_530248 [Lentinula edodes]|uniref:Uncharacterized protein n=1 Tax=Lentinula lateritia TaxID=40482 RepID=A0A9W8ZQP0_9AGAR|nr:hypothetical protein C8J55DRAFT_530248 [Lentinula edodes]